MSGLLSYGAEDHDLTEASLALTGPGHELLFAKDSLPIGGGFRARIDKRFELPTS